MPSKTIIPNYTFRLLLVQTDIGRNSVINLSGGFIELVSSDTMRAPKLLIYDKSDSELLILTVTPPELCNQSIGDNDPPCQFIYYLMLNYKYKTAIISSNVYSIIFQNIYNFWLFNLQEVTNDFLKDVGI